MEKGKSHAINILETPVSTVTNSGHWFHATRQTIQQYVPGLMKFYPFEELISKAVAWIDSADSLAMLLYFVLAFTINPWVAAGIALLFHYVWYQRKSAFVSIPFTPVVKLFNKDVFQLLVAAVALSFMGITGMYLAVVLGIFCFFLFKVGLLRRLWDKLESPAKSNKLPLNDRVLKMVLVRYSLYQNIPPKDVQKIDEHVKKAVLDAQKPRKK